MKKQGILKLYKEFLPVTERTPSPSLGEGSTPLILAPRLAERAGFLGKLYLKWEGANAGSFSFKDRGMALAIAKAVEEGSIAVVCASTGNTLASAAAYSALFGIRCIGIVAKGGVARGKLIQAHRYGAKVIEIDGTFDDAYDIACKLSDQYAVTNVNSRNHYRLEGQKTAAFEIWEELGHAPDYLFIPVGNGGNITAYWKGFKEYASRLAIPILAHEDWEDIFTKSTGRIFPMPRMMGWQSKKANPIVRGKAVEKPASIASAINIGNPALWSEAVAAARESGGQISDVTDREIEHWYREMPRLSGVFCEMASATSIAGLSKAVREGTFGRENHPDSIVVCVLTGNGLKDPDNAMRDWKEPTALESDIGKIAKYLKL